jgi:hypothetical protein
MLEKFICLHCKGSFSKNPRIKVEQHYCGSKSCQQGRKNTWEKKKLMIDVGYKAKRKAAQKRSYSKRRGDKYQSAYRKTHPEYCQDNRKKQVLRNKKRKPPPVSPKIVNTDALIPKGLIPQGLYAFLPYNNTDTKKIVNTDSLFVQLYAVQGLGDNFMINSV